MASITLEQVSRRFVSSRKGDAPQMAVREVSLKVSEGGCLALLGPSGCGKTTLLKLIAGLEQPDTGQVLYNHSPLKEMPAFERGIGMVFQDYALIPNRQARFSVSFFLRIRHRQREVSERIREVARMTGVGIETLLEKYPRHLSGGEQQRVAIARAFARDLDVLLLDEPFGSLDAQFRATARIELKRLLLAYPVTTVLVTHDQQEAAALADRLAIMREGRIVQVGTYEHLYAQPASQFVAEFIGVPTMNMFDGVVVGGVWQALHLPGVAVPCPLPDGAVRLGLRSEQVHLSAAGIPARVEVVQPHFAERYCLLDVRQGAALWQVRAPLEATVRPGDLIHCTLEAAHALYFDAATGARLLPSPAG
ncbi:MAG: ABC transporter ATP-binding protein [Anaerolineae bacterium]|jgi:ABC-type sugar transport system ATPase subunit|nr:ABC transporter ATP-binding protein [Anaerolineae bacterium]